MKRRQTILLAEDDDDAVLLLKMACARSRLINPMNVVSDGQNAIGYLSGEGVYADRGKFPLPALLLLDLKMPRKNGFEVLSWIRSNTAVNRLPVVVLTSSRDAIAMQTSSHSDLNPTRREPCQR